METIANNYYTDTKRVHYKIIYNYTHGECKNPKIPMYLICCVRRMAKNKSQKSHINRHNIYLYFCVCYTVFEKLYCTITFACGTKIH